MTRRPVLAAAAIALSTLAAAVGVAPVPAGAGGDTIELFTEVDPGAVDGTYVPVKGTYEPTVLHDDVGKDDIVWVKPSGGATSVWSFTGQGAQHAVHPVSTIPGARPLVGDFDGNGFDDAFWYGPGSIPDAAWYGTGDGTFAVQPASVTGAYQPVVAQLTQSNGTQPRSKNKSPM